MGRQIHPNLSPPTTVEALPHQNRQPSPTMDPINSSVGAGRGEAMDFKRAVARWGDATEKEEHRRLQVRSEGAESVVPSPRLARLARFEMELAAAC